MALSSSSLPNKRCVVLRFSNRTAGEFQPFSLTRVHVGRKLAVDLFVISIEPQALLRYQKLGIYQARVDRAKCESLELVIRQAVFTREPISSGSFFDEDKVLESNPILSRLVVARLIAEDVARFDRQPGVLRRTDAARPFVHIQKRTYAVPGPVVVIQSGVPEGGPSQRVQSSTGDTARKRTRPNRMCPCSTRVKRSLCSALAFFPSSTVRVISVVPSRY